MERPQISEIEVALGPKVSRKDIVEVSSDPFSVQGEDVRKIAGMSPAFRRKTSRELTKVYSGDGAASKKMEFENITGYTLFDVVIPPYNLEYLAKLNELSAAHYAAVKAKVANIVGLGFDLVETTTTQDRMDKIESDEQTQKARRKIAKVKREILAWLDSCNKEDEFMETLIKVWTDYETTGNGYLEVGRKINGQIGYIGHAPSVSMRIRKERDGFVQVFSNRAVFFRNFGDLGTTDKIGNDPRPNEIIHFKKYSPTNNYYGIPDIVAAQQAIAGNEFSSRFNLDYFENKAVPRYVVVIKGGSLSHSAQRNILEFFETDLRGKNHRSMFVPLPPDTAESKTSFEMKPVESGTQDASFMNYNKANLRDILMAHRVPMGKVTSADGNSLAAARDADKTFKEQVCRPEQKIAEKKINKIFAEITDVFELKLNELTLTDEDTLSKIDERYLRWGVMVPNEIRKRWGWTGIKDGDRPVGMMQQTEMSNQMKAEIASQANATRERAANRSSGASDSSGEARQPKGDGRAVS